MAVLKGYVKSADIKATDFEIVDILQAEFGKEIGEYIKEETAEVLWNAGSVKVGYSKRIPRKEEPFESSFTLGFDVVVKDCDASEIVEIARDSGDYSSSSKDFYILQQELDTKIGGSAYTDQYSYFNKLCKRILKVYKESADWDTTTKGCVMIFKVYNVDIKGSNVAFEVFAKILLRNY